MTTRVKLTIRLPAEELDDLESYAAEHGVTVTELLNRFLSRLRDRSDERAVHPEVWKIAGLVPANVDARTLYHEHLIEKHRRSGSSST